MLTDEEKKSYAVAKAKKDFMAIREVRMHGEKALDAFLSAAYDFHLLYRWRKKYQPAEYWREYRRRPENKLRRSLLAKEKYRNDPEFREKSLQRSREYYRKKKKLCSIKKTE